MAVDALFARLEGALPQLAAVGQGTAEALREQGVEPDLVARISTQEGLAAELPRPPGGCSFAGAEDARGVLVQELGADFVPVYRTVELRPEAFPAADLVVLASALRRPRARGARASSAVRLDRPGDLRRGARCGSRLVAEAETHDREGLVAAVKLAASNAGSSPS